MATLDGVDIPARLQPIDNRARPDFRIIDGVKTLQPQRFARARLIDDQRGNAALGEPAGKADAIFHLLGGIEPIDLDEKRRSFVDAFGAHEKAGKMRLAIGDFDPLAIFAGKANAATAVAHAATRPASCAISRLAYSRRSRH